MLLYTAQSTTATCLSCQLLEACVYIYIYILLAASALTTRHTLPAKVALTSQAAAVLGLYNSLED